MTNRMWITVGSIGLVCAGGASRRVPADPVPVQQAAPPALLVLLSVDQMRADYIERFGPQFTGGLRRLLDGGVSYQDVRHDHAFTHTAPGHAVLVTGVHPARNGVVSNDWWDRKERRRIYAVEDRDAPIVGSEWLPGRSPRNLLRPTIADWLRAASPASKAYSVAIKDRVAVIMGGHHPDGAYWYDYESGRYITSSYYRDDYPEWLIRFNDSGPAPGYIGQEWNRLLAPDRYGASREDDFVPEGEGMGAVFPHRIAGSEELEISAFQELARTPFGDAVTLALAREVIQRESLGADDVPDFLAIGASAADLIGHRFGPYSQEIQDYYLRLDVWLGEFLEFLDAEIGSGRWQIMLTADHGVATMPEEAIRRGEDARRVTTADFRTELIEGLTDGMRAAEIFAQPGVQLLYPLGVVVDFEGDETTEEQMVLFRKTAAVELATADVVKRVFTYDDMLRGKPVGDPVEFQLLLNSFHPDRAADFIIHFRRGFTYPDVLPATHGSLYDYDTRVPLIIYGARTASQVDRPVRTVDIAPTLARLLGIPVPNDLDGEVLSEFAR